MTFFFFFSTQQLSKCRLTKLVSLLRMASRGRLVIGRLDLTMTINVGSTTSNRRKLNVAKGSGRLKDFEVNN